MGTHGVAPPPGQVDPSRPWDAGGGAAMGAPSAPALAFAIGMGLMLSVPLLLALTIAGCWWRCQQRNTRRWSREDSCHMPSARWSECREDPSDDDDYDDDDDDDDELVGARREEEPISPRRLLLASSDEEEATPRRQRVSRPGRISRRGTGGRSTSAAEPELTKVFFRSSDWSSHSQPKMAELSLQGVASVQELCARLRAALGRGALAEGLALSIEYEDCMGEMSQLTHGAEVDVLVGARSLYVTTKRAKSLPPEPASSKASSTSQCSSLQPLVAAGDGDDDLSGCSGVKSTCGGIEVASSAVPRKRSRPERHRSRLTKLKHYFTL